MIDFHSHILPEIDDGSKSADESIEMLKLLKDQGVTKVVATPHFYANKESVKSFLARRESSYKKIEAYINESLPDIVPGAEVRYYDGISHLDDLNKLCISGTDLLLLEMPSTKWTEYVLRELIALASKGDITVVLAHIERYIRLQPQGLFKKLLDSGILMQISSDYVYEFLTRRKALKLLADEQVRFIGTDCHDMKHRPPDMDKAVEIISKKLGRDFLDYFVHCGNRFFR